MPDLAATDVTYSLVNAAFTRGDQGYRRTFDVTFGDSALTYPAGGVPLTNAKMGCPYNLLLVEVASPDTDSNSATWEWDQANNTLRAWAGGTELTGAVDAVALRVEATGY